MKARILCPFLILLLVPFGGISQRSYPKGYFRSPIDFPIQLSGAFGDIRTNHFHSGIDIRTESVEGKPVYAAADGYVSRIFISPYGFGKALYVTHPNGFTTVYGHLKSFNRAIGSWIRSRQYEKESFEIDTPVEAGILKVRKGEIIAYSGNSGSSGGPHLHFEIRDSPTQEVINPLFFGFPVTDVSPPRIGSLRIYPYDDRSMVNFVTAAATFRAEGSAGKYKLVTTDTIRVSGNLYFGIEVSDEPEGGSIRSGVNSIVLMVDSTECFSQEIDRFSFSETRYVNALIDYALMVTDNRKVQRSYLAANNKLDIYGPVINRGIMNFTDSRAHRIRYTIKDASGNVSRLEFWVRSHPPAPIRKENEKAKEGTFFSCKVSNRFAGPGIDLEIPADALYEDLWFLYSVLEPPVLCKSPVHVIHNPTVPLQKAATLSIRPDSIPPELASRAVIVKIGENGKFESMGGEWEEGAVTTRIREFGRYSIRLDTVPPVIRAVNLYPGKTVTRQNSFLVKISDNLSGISSYRGTLNGKWILMDYDAKNNLLKYEFDDRIHPGKNLFRLVVSDGRGNRSAYEATVTR